MNIEQRYKIGIVGCGHLGQAIALAFLQNSLPRDRLLLSYRGSKETHDHLADKGLLDCVVSNDRLLNEADVIFITIKPQDFSAFKNAAIRTGVAYISPMAGIPLDLLREVYGDNVYRMMISGPDTILSGHGVAVAAPRSETLEQLMDMIHVNLLKISGEAELNVFTAGVCIPAALLQLDDPLNGYNAIERLFKDYPMMAPLYTWSLEVVPKELTRDEKDAYITRMVTKGGITEAVINTIKSNHPLDMAMKNGIARAEEISAATLAAFRQ